MTIIAFGDSHSFNTFRDLDDLVVDKRQSPGLTMYRVGRDGLKFNNYMKIGDKLFYCLGEIDVRCHIHKQIQSGREKEEVINSLAENYVNAILKRDKEDLHKQIKMERIIMSVVPPCRFDKTKQNPEYPCVGSDEERVEYTKLLNNKLEELCKKNNIMFFNVYQFYADLDGHMNPKLSKDGVHISDCKPVIEYLKSLKLI